jgi:F-type H+-transporting ATPase subunit b
MHDLIAQREFIQRAGVVDLDASVLFMLVLYLVFFFLMNKMLLTPLREVFEKRHSLTDGAREEADKAVATAEAKIAEYQKKVGAARREALNKAKEIKAEGQKAEREMLDGVRKEVDAEVQKGLDQLNAQKAEAEKGLESNANETGNRIATVILGGAA